MNIDTGQVYRSLPAAIADLKAHQSPAQVVEITEAQATDPIATLLLLYSEWLDTNGLMRSPRQSGDDRTHEELVKAFKAGHGRVIA